MAAGCPSAVVGCEVTQILWKKRQNISETEGLAILDDLLGAGIEFTPQDVLMEDAHRLARRFDCSAYDAFYLALAQYLDCPLITADERLYNAVRASEIQRYDFLYRFAIRNLFRNCSSASRQLE
jgi:predicted nucleic acid-binding protein